MVLFNHYFLLLPGNSDFESFKELVGKSLGDIDVNILFMTSGFLIVNSLFLKNDLKSFIWTISSRIYPGLIVALLIFVFGPYFTI